MWVSKDSSQDACRRTDRCIQVRLIVPNALDMSKARLVPKVPTCVLHMRLRAPEGGRRANCSGLQCLWNLTFCSMHDRNVPEGRGQDQRAQSSLLLLQSRHSALAEAVRPHPLNHAVSGQRRRWDPRRRWVSGTRSEIHPARARRQWVRAHL